MFKILSLSNVFFWIEKLIGFINSVFFILLLAALSFALIFSPPDYLQGDSVRIMYVHVPSAWIGLASFSLIAILSIVHFIVMVFVFLLSCYVYGLGQSSFICVSLCLLYLSFYYDDI